MKSVLFGSMSVLGLLFAMASCQNMRSVDNYWQKEQQQKQSQPTEKWGEMRREVSLVLKRTDSMQEFEMVKAEI